MKTLGKAGVCPGSFTWQLQGERGSGTVMTVGLVLLGVSLTLGVTQIAVAIVGMIAAHEAADLTALMATTSVLTGDSGYATATEHAVKNRVTLTLCQVNGWVVQVEVVRPLGFGLVTEARDSAKAGPGFAGP